MVLWEWDKSEPVTLAKTSVGFSMHTLFCVWAASQKEKKKESNFIHEAIQSPTNYIHMQLFSISNYVTPRHFQNMIANAK